MDGTPVGLTIPKAPASRHCRGGSRTAPTFTYAANRPYIYVTPPIYVRPFRVDERGANEVSGVCTGNGV